MKVGKNYKQGIYSPTNRNKYQGKTDPRYLSGWELRFFVWCDSCPRVVGWCSEKVIVPYFDPVSQRVRNYFVDNMITQQESDGLKNYIIEIKPYRETQPPKITKKKKPSTLEYEKATYLRNIAKWEAAKRWAAANNCIFMLFTEHTLAKLN